MSDLDEFWVHPCTVEPYLGQGADGAGLYGPPVAVTGWLDETVKWVRGQDGIEVVSSSTLYLPAATAGQLTAGSRLTLPDGRVAAVISVSRQTSAGLGLPDHVVVALT